MPIFIRMFIAIFSILPSWCFSKEQVNKQLSMQCNLSFTLPFVVQDSGTLLQRSLATVTLWMRFSICPIVLKAFMFTFHSMVSLVNCYTWGQVSYKACLGFKWLRSWPSASLWKDCPSRLMGSFCLLLLWRASYADTYTCINILWTLSHSVDLYVLGYVFPISTWLP